MVSHMQFLEVFSHLQKRGLLYTISKITFSSPKMLTIICNFCNFFPFSENVDYHMQFMKFLSLLQKRGLSYAILGKFFLFSKNVDYIMQFMKFVSLLQKRGLSYAISGTS